MYGQDHTAGEGAQYACVQIEAGLFEGTGFKGQFVLVLSSVIILLGVCRSLVCVSTYLVSVVYT